MGYRRAMVQRHRLGINTAMGRLFQMFVDVFISNGSLVDKKHTRLMVVL